MLFKRTKKFLIDSASLRLDSRIKFINEKRKSRLTTEYYWYKGEKKNIQKTLSRQSLLTHDRKRSLAYNEDEQYKSVVFNRAFPS